MPHECVPPVVTLWNASRPVTTDGTGLVAQLADNPLPSWPFWFEPQQYALPVAVTPQVCASPALTEVNEAWPCTACGDVTLEFIPGIGLEGSALTPTCPLPFEPQQYATFATVHPQACPPPLVTPANFMLPETAVGMPVEVVVPVPSWPLELAPQQYAVPSAVRPQVNPAPALIDANVFPPVTATGTVLPRVVPSPS